MQFYEMNYDQFDSHTQQLLQYLKPHSVKIVAPEDDTIITDY